MPTEDAAEACGAFANAGPERSKGADGAGHVHRLWTRRDPIYTLDRRRICSRQARFLAEEVAPAITPALDPTDLEDLRIRRTFLRGGPILTLRGRGDVAAAVAVRAGRVQAIGDEGSVWPSGTTDLSNRPTVKLSSRVS